MGHYKGFSNLNGQSRMHIHDVTNLELELESDGPPGEQTDFDREIKRYVINRKA